MDINEMDINEIIEETKNAIYEIKKHKFLNRPVIWLNSKLLYLDEDYVSITNCLTPSPSCNYKDSMREVVTFPKTFCGLKTAGTFESDFTNFIITEDPTPVPEEKTPLSDYSTKELLEEIERRMSDD